MTTSTLTAPSTASPYPFAAAPDIIRSHQKDAYFTGTLANTLAELHRSVRGARAAHAWAAEGRVLASLLYFSLTTLAGRRTLGEEYTDVVQLHVGNGNNNDDKVLLLPDKGKGTTTAAAAAGILDAAAAAEMPSPARRAAYIASSVLLPYLAGKTLPALRARLRAALEARLARLAARGKGKTREARVWLYLLRHLDTITSTSAGPVYALGLAVFYFSGTYYELSKRLLGLRYAFTRRVPETPDRAGYEVLGALLVVQLATQTYLHVRATILGEDEEGEGENGDDATREGRPAAAEMHGAGVDVSRSDNHYSSNNQLLAAPPLGQGQGGGGKAVDLAAATHTPVLGKPRYNLEDGRTMAFVRGPQQRKCTLCLEMLRDPAATQCGHVFCWDCIGDWVREKPECPLCRREALPQHVLPLRVV